MKPADSASGEGPLNIVRVLIVANREDDFLLTKECLNRSRYEPGCASVQYLIERADSLEAARNALTGQHDVMLLDLSLAEGESLSGVQRLLNPAPPFPVLFLCGKDEDALALKALQLDATDYVRKDKRDPYILSRALSYALERFRMAVRQEELRAAAAASNETGARFLANLAHEIRSPLSGIIGYSEMLRFSALPPAARERALTTIVKDSRHLLQLVNDVLDLSKLETGELAIRKSPCSVIALGSDIESVVRAKAHEKGIFFSISYQYPLPAQVITDPVRLNQILLNLCGNAVKFTEQGGVLLAVAFDAGAGDLVFRVIDSGIGISREDQARIFEPFVHCGKDRHERGTGLGLSLSRALAKLIGAAITVESEPGKGSAFTLRLKVGGLAGVTMLHSRPSSHCEKAHCEKALPQEGRAT